jgi:hypothetical protein
MFRDSLFFLDCLTLKYGKNMLSRKVFNYQSMLRDILGNEDIIYAMAETWNHIRISF